MSIREFNSNISKALSAAEKGEDIVLTRHGKQVLRVTREGLVGSSATVDLDKDKDRLRMLAIMRKGIDLGGPFSYEERTGLDRLL